MINETGQSVYPGFKNLPIMPVHALARFHHHSSQIRQKSCQSPSRTNRRNRNGYKRRTDSYCHLYYCISYRFGAQVKGFLLFAVIEGLNESWQLQLQENGRLG